MQTLEKALENLVHNMEILRDTLNKQHKSLNDLTSTTLTYSGVVTGLTNTLDFIRDDISELDSKINELNDKLNEIKEKTDALGG